jgi:hypothetical protein
VHLIDALGGIERKEIYTKSHGGGIVKYTHHEAHVLMSSEKARSNDVRYGQKEMTNVVLVVLVGRDNEY